MPKVAVSDILIGGGCPLVLIAGPCVIESEKSCLNIAADIRDIAKEAGIPYIFKASYDKANRLSIDSYRGPGIKKGLEILAKVKQKLKVPILSDVHCQREIEQAKVILDVIQIPAFLCRQTDIVVAAAKTGKVINVKKGQFLAPWDILPIIRKIESVGNKKITVTERGVSFGYNNLVSDFRSLPVMRDFGYPVLFDATHSVQQPGGLGKSSGGNRGFVPYLAKAAVAVGCDGIFAEVHPDPARALSDSSNMLNLKEIKKLLTELKNIYLAVSKRSSVKK